MEIQIMKNSVGKLILISVSAFFLLLVGGILLSMSLYKVDAGELAIVSRYGKIVDQKDS